MDLHPYHGLLPRSGPQLFYHAKLGFGEFYIVKTQFGEGIRYPLLAIKRSTNKNPTSRFIRGVEDRGHWAALDGVLVREIQHRLSLHWHKMVEVLLYLLFFVIIFTLRFIYILLII